LRACSSDLQITNYKSEITNELVKKPLGPAARMKPVKTTASQTELASEVEPLLLEVADVVNTTLDLETTLRRVAELVRKVIDYEIFAILLLNEQRQELYVRFNVGYPPEVADRLRVKVGQGVTGRAAQTRQAVLVADATQEDFYLEAVPNVHSELAIPLIVKNRLIGVIDIEARQKGYFTEEHKRLLTLIASRMAVGIENARLHTRITRQARTLLLLNEIAR
jgi:sigma-B regulation protein RsbU (phosphoserine phosphatase)